MDPINIDNPEGYLNVRFDRMNDEPSSFLFEKFGLLLRPERAEHQSMKPAESSQLLEDKEFRFKR